LLFFRLPLPLFACQLLLGFSQNVVFVQLQMSW
jgi:hypothetical protein